MVHRLNPVLWCVARAGIHLELTATHRNSYIHKMIQIRTEKGCTNFRDFFISFYIGKKNLITKWFTRIKCKYRGGGFFTFRLAKKLGTFLLRLYAKRVLFDAKLIIKRNQLQVVFCRVKKTRMSASLNFSVVALCMCACNRRYHKNGESWNLTSKWTLKNRCSKIEDALNICICTFFFCSDFFQTFHIFFCSFRDLYGHAFLSLFLNLKKKM